MIGVRRCGRLRPAEAAPIRALKAFLAHKLGDPLATDPDTTAESQLGLHAPRTIRAARAGEDLLDLTQQGTISDRAAATGSAEGIMLAGCSAWQANDSASWKSWQVEATQRGFGSLAKGLAEL